MMQLACRASLVVVLLLLVLVDTASAECAWLMWNEGTASQRATIDPRGPKGR